MIDRVTNPKNINPKEEAEEQASVQLRPSRIVDYIGQTQIKQNLNLAIKSARTRKSPLDHMLFYGPPGLGKTTLAQILANEMTAQLKVTAGPAIQRAGDLAALLSNLSPGDILFIDEIHRLNRSVEEILYTAMEDYAVDIIMGKGIGAQSLRIDIAPFTLIGATTRYGALSSPLRDRFGMISRLQFYNLEEMKELIRRNAKILKLELDEDSLTELASRTRYTPRIANRILKRVRDYCVANKLLKIELRHIEEVFDSLSIDSLGLDSGDQQILKIMLDHYRNRPVGLKTLAAAANEDLITIEEVYEPYLLRLGLISRTSQGRILTPKAIKHMQTK